MNTLTCKNCSSEVVDKYCSNCGYPAVIRRIDGRYIIHEIEHVLHLERGIFYTNKELLLRPGENVRNFILENRSRLVKPIIFIIVTSLIYSLVNYFFQIEDGYVNYQELNQTTTGKIFQWVQGHYGYANIIMGVFIAFWLKLFFRKYDYNFFEILILICFVMGMGMLIYAVFAIIQGLTHFEYMQVAGIVGLLYCAWAIGQFFDKKKAINYVKAFGTYMLGMLSFIIVAITLGNFIDILIT